VGRVRPLVLDAMGLFKLGGEGRSRGVVVYSVGLFSDLESREETEDGSQELKMSMITKFRVLF